MAGPDRRPSELSGWLLPGDGFADMYSRIGAKVGPLAMTSSSSSNNIRVKPVALCFRRIARIEREEPMDKDSKQHP